MNPDSPISQQHKFYKKLGYLAGGLSGFYELAWQFFIRDRKLHDSDLPFRYSTYSVPQALQDVWFPNETLDDIMKSHEVKMVSALDESLRVKTADEVLVVSVPKGGRTDYLRNIEESKIRGLPTVLSGGGIYATWVLDHPFWEVDNSYLVAFHTTHSFVKPYDETRVALVSVDIEDFLQRCTTRLGLEKSNFKVDKPLGLKDFGEFSHQVLQTRNR